MRALFRVFFLLFGGLIVAAGCGSDDADTSSSNTSEADDTGGDAALANACPVDGCQISIVSAAPSGDDALEVTFEANFGPDFTKNHIHLYWDTFEAGEVSSDAEANGFTQGDWSPTGDFPTFITDSATLISNRGESTTLCVTAANRDHAVLDAGSVECFDVSDAIG